MNLKTKYLFTMFFVLQKTKPLTTNLKDNKFNTAFLKNLLDILDMT